MSQRQHPDSLPVYNLEQTIVMAIGALRDGWIGLSVSPELYRLEQRLLEQEQRMRKERP